MEFLLSFLYGSDDQTYCLICCNLIRFYQADLLISSFDTVPLFKQHALHHRAMEVLHLLAWVVSIENGPQITIASMYLSKPATLP